MKILKIKYKNNFYSTTIDLVDYEWIKNHSLKIVKCKSKIYVKIYIGHQKYNFLHREILLKHGLLNNKMVDHIDGNGLNNQKNNLRSCSRQQNNFNQKTQQRVKTSKYKGVTRLTTCDRWCSRIKINQKNT